MKPESKPCVRGVWLRRERNWLFTYNIWTFRYVKGKYQMRALFVRGSTRTGLHPMVVTRRVNTEHCGRMRGDREPSYKQLRHARKRNTRFQRTEKCFWLASLDRT